MDSKSAVVRHSRRARSCGCLYAARGSAGQAHHSLAAVFPTGHSRRHDPDAREGIEGDSNGAF